MLTQEPTPAGVTAALVLVALALASAASLVLLRSAGTARGPRARTARGGALRRGVETGLAVALLAALQVAGGLTPLTALFVVLSFAIAEYLLSAGESAPR